MNLLFKEEQKFTQWWLWLILSALFLIPVLLWYQRLSAEEGVEPSMSVAGLVVFSAFIFGLVLLFYFIRLRTEIDKKEIRMNFFPLLKKRVKWEEVENAEVVNYGFVGGWGIRFWTRFGIVYNIKGNKGLAVELKSGKKCLIGTQKEAELQEVVKKLKVESL